MTDLILVRHGETFSSMLPFFETRSINESSICVDE